MTPTDSEPPDAAGGGFVPEHWARWWYYNRGAYLEVSRVLAGREVRTGEEGGRVGLPDERIRKEIVPAIEAALTEGGDLGIIHEGLMALARIGEAAGSSGTGLGFYAKHFLGGRYASLQEASIVALGVHGDPAWVPLLRAILDNTEAGRELTGTETVPVRLRAFAAFGLGLLGQGTEDQDLRLAVVHSLLASLGNQRTATREIQVACVLAVGLVELDFCGDTPEEIRRHVMEGDRHLCGGVQIRYLLDVFRDPELDFWVRAHVAPSIGRLSREAPPDFHLAALEELGGALDPRSKEPEPVHQGAVLGLGLFADGDEDPDDVAARELLEKTMRRGDPLSRRLAMIGLARAAARPGTGENEGKGLTKAHTLLVQELARGRRDRKAWAALALGALGHERVRAQRGIPEEVTGALRLALARARDPEEAAAVVTGIGILRDEEARDEVLSSFERIEDPGFRACAALTLGLVDAKEGRDAIRETFLGPDCCPTELRLDVALGLRLLGDSEVTEGLVHRLDAAETPEERATLLQFLGELEDPRGIDALLATLKDADEDPLVRAVAINALGRICESRTIPWAAAYATDVQYGLLTWTLESPFDDGSGLLDWR